MTRNHFGLACAAICLFPLIVRADRAPDDRAEVPVVVIGRVVSISESWDLEHDYYRVQIRVEEVDRGQSIAAGEAIEVAIYRWSRPWPGYVGGSGHELVPDVGDRLRVFAVWADSGYAGCYREWCDVVEPTDSYWISRIFARRKARVAFWMFGIAIVVTACHRVRKKFSRQDASRQSLPVLPMAGQ